MAAIEALAIAATSTVLKKIFDDIYVQGKLQVSNVLAIKRSDINEGFLAKAILSITKVKTLWNFDQEVSLYDFYYPSRISFPKGMVKGVNNLQDLGSRSNIVIQGTAGQGKSIFLRYLCGQELQGDSISKRIPIFVELKRVGHGLGVLELILEALEKLKLPNTRDAWSYLASTEKFVLLLDAFDEIDPSLVSNSLYEIEKIVDLYGEKLQIVITSRPDAEIQKSSRFRVCKLVPLTRDDHLPFLKRICQQELQAEELFRALEGSKSEMRGLLSTPLMMTLFVLVFKALQIIPDTVPKFYEELFDVLFYRHDNTKAGFNRARFTKLDDSKIKDLFSAFCFFVRLHGLGVLTTAKFIEATKEATQLTGIPVNPDGFKNELIKTLCLLQQDGFEYSFVHKSVVQYYAAAFVRSSNVEFAEQFYQLVAQQHSAGWELELRFLAQIDSYNYSKYYEMPILLEAARKIGYSFEQYDKMADARLRAYLVERMNLMVWRNGRREDNDKIVGWSYSEGRADPVLTALGNKWGAKLSSEVASNKIFYNDVYKDNNGDLLEDKELNCLLIKNEINKWMPNLEREVLSSFQERYDSAMAIIRTEEAKTSMLKKLLK